MVRKTPCTDTRCRKHHGPNAAGQGTRPFRVGWYHEYGEPHHAPNCRHYRGASHFSGLSYDTREEAIAAGHPPAKCCGAAPAPSPRFEHEVRAHGDMLRLYCKPVAEGNSISHFIEVDALPDFRPAFCWHCGSKWPGGPNFKGWIHNSPCEACHGMGCTKCQLPEAFTA